MCVVAVFLVSCLDKGMVGVKRVLTEHHCYVVYSLPQVSLADKGTFFAVTSGARADRGSGNGDKGTAAPMRNGDGTAYRGRGASVGHCRQERAMPLHRSAKNSRRIPPN